MSILSDNGPRALAAGPQVLPEFVPFVPKTKHRDLTEDVYAAKSCAFLTGKFWQLDMSAVVFSGYQNDLDKSSTLHAVITDDNGEVLYDVTFDEAPFFGVVDIRAKEGKSIREAIGVDIIGDTMTTWLSLNGYPSDFPCASTCRVDRNGFIDLRIGPVM
jgi:hypothetical protein